jgi:uncharacterized protein YxjI
VDESIDSILLQPVLIHRHVGSLLRTGDFDVLDRSGDRIAVVREEGVTRARAWLRPLGRLEPLTRRSLVVRGPSGTIILSLTKPRNLVRGRFHVRDAAGTDIVTLRQRHSAAHFAFDLLAPGGTVAGRMNGQDWMAGRRFVVVDGKGQQMAEVRMTEPGTTDNYPVPEYIVELTSRQPRSLAVAAAIGPIGIHLMLNAGRF